MKVPILPAKPGDRLPINQVIKTWGYAGLDRGNKSSPTNLFVEFQDKVKILLRERLKEYSYRISTSYVIHKHLFGIVLDNHCYNRSLKRILRKRGVLLSTVLCSFGLGWSAPALDYIGLWNDHVDRAIDYIIGGRVLLTPLIPLLAYINLSFTSLDVYLP